MLYKYLGWKSWQLHFCPTASGYMGIKNHVTRTRIFEIKYVGEYGFIMSGQMWKNKFEFRKLYNFEKLHIQN